MIGLVKHKKIISFFKEAVDYLNHMFFYRVSLRALFPTTIQSFFSTLVTDLKQFETLFKPHLY